VHVFIFANNKPSTGCCLLSDAVNFLFDKDESALAALPPLFSFFPTAADSFLLDGDAALSATTALFFPEFTTTAVGTDSAEVLSQFSCILKDSSNSKELSFL
jgi:hypothetical protein